MASDSGERATVRTYVPKYQKERWQAHAKELDMSQSEFVRTMVQAGRSGFEPPDSAGSPQRGSDGNPEEGRSSDTDPGGNSLEDRVIEVLETGDHFDWNELLSALTDDIEQRLDDTLQDLQSAGRVRYSGRHGGYVLAE